MVRNSGIRSLAFACALSLTACSPTNNADLGAARQEAADLKTRPPVDQAAAIISPAEALNCIGQTRTVEFRVSRGDLVTYDEIKGKYHKVHLSDAAEVQSGQRRIQVAIAEDSLAQFKVSNANELIEAYRNKLVRVTGKVKLDEGFDNKTGKNSDKHVFIEVDGPDRICIVADEK
jgi:hypothetical protein